MLYNSTLLDRSQWAFTIIQMLLGEMDHETFIQLMGENLKSGRELVDRLCEGYFYLAKDSLLTGDVERAKNYFRLALSTNVYEFVEHKYALLELPNLYREAAKAYQESNSPVIPTTDPQATSDSITNSLT